MRKQYGFSLITLLLTVAIIGILLVLSLQNYQPVLQSFQTGSGSRESFKMNISRAQLMQLHRMEMLYFNLHRSYATWDQLVKDGLIARGYTNLAQGKGSPFIPYYDIDIQVKPDGFIITATPNFPSGAAPGSPILRIDEDGVIEEVPSK